MDSKLWNSNTFRYIMATLSLKNNKIMHPFFILKKSLNISKGKSESVYRKRTDNTMMKRKKDKQRSTKHKHKTKDRVTRKIVLSHLPRNTFRIGPFYVVIVGGPQNHFPYMNCYVRSKWYYIIIDLLSIQFGEPHYLAICLRYV